MANTYFQFKQFTIHQDRCAMKVSTEACLLGAWVPNHRPDRILDIGTGTGLLALMLAQRIECPIDGIELDKSAFEQAVENVGDSPWADRVQIVHRDIFEYVRQTPHRYDLIVSNPPFFQNSLKPDTAQKNLAKHDTVDFDKQRLAAVLQTLLTDKGKAYILYPEHEAGQFVAALKHQGLCAAVALIIRNQPDGPIFRCIVVVSKSSMDLTPEALNIRAGKEHTQAFNDLLREYYLKL